MQIELYQQGSNEEAIYTVAGSPMLAANGMSKPDDGSSIESGPGRVLFAPAGDGFTSSWAYIQPAAENLKAITERMEKRAETMRLLGLLPNLARTGNVTATASGIQAAKGHSAVQTWANALKDALEQAFVFTAQWLGTAEEVEVSVNTDFAVGLYGADEVRVLLDARKEAQISQGTLWDEYQRRGVLGPQFDPKKEAKLLAEENPPFDPQDELAALAAQGLPADGREAPPVSGRDAPIEAARG